MDTLINGSYLVLAFFQHVEVQMSPKSTLTSCYFTTHTWHFDSSDHEIEYASVDPKVQADFVLGNKTWKEIFTERQTSDIRLTVIY